MWEVYFESRFYLALEVVYGIINVTMSTSMYLVIEGLSDVSGFWGKYISILLSESHWCVHWSFAVWKKLILKWCDIIPGPRSCYWYMWKDTFILTNVWQSRSDMIKSCSLNAGKTCSLHFGLDSIVSIFLNKLTCNLLLLMVLELIQILPHQ